MSSQAEVDLELYQWLGKLTADFATLEAHMGLCISYLIGDDLILGRTITAELSSRNLVSVLNTLYEYRVDDPAKVEKLRTLLIEIQSLEDRRNRMVHSQWFLNPKTKQMLRKKLTTRFKTGFNIQMESVAPSELNRLANEIVIATLELDEIVSSWVQSKKQAAS
jgi:hypothetical protein